MRALEKTDFDARQVDGDVVEARQQERADRAAVGHLLNDGWGGEKGIL